MNQETFTGREIHQYGDTGEKVKLQVGTDPKFCRRFGELDFKKSFMHSGLGLHIILGLCWFAVHKDDNHC